ncbi:MAG TPA: hypothetical protein PKI11_15400 [Candidatus Hydrogenedentes bacterium]|nr:hypothetical protein [Candidatus Hydrogenedentota bacterium]
MQSISSMRGPLADRLTAFSLYFGWAPFRLLKSGDVQPLRGHRERFLRHHCDQALVLFLALFVIAIFFVTCAAAVSYAVVHQRNLYENVALEQWLLTLFRWLAISWAVFWAYGVGGAILGSMWELPGVAALARRRAVVVTAAAVQGFVYAALVVLAVFAAYASRSARDDDAPADVYLLYEDVDRYPRWLFVVAFHPATRAALDSFGENGVTVRKLTRESLASALEHGRFVFIGSHGQASGMLLDRQWFPPQEAAALRKGERLALVYLAGCDSGAQEAAWRAALAPAEVVTHDRLTAMVEHVWWLWTEAPEIIRRLAAEAGARRETEAADAAVQ